MSACPRWGGGLRLAARAAASLALSGFGRQAGSLVASSLGARAPTAYAARASRRYPLPALQACESGVYTPGGKAGEARVMAWLIPLSGFGKAGANKSFSAGGGKTKTKTKSPLQATVIARVCFAKTKCPPTQAVSVLRLQPFGFPLLALRTRFPQEEERNLYKIFTKLPNPNFSKKKLAPGSPQHQKIFRLRRRLRCRLRRKTFCPSGSCCFGEYLFFETKNNLYPPFIFVHFTSHSALRAPHLSRILRLPSYVRTSVPP